MSHLAPIVPAPTERAEVLSFGNAPTHVKVLGQAMKEILKHYLAIMIRERGAVQPLVLLPIPIVYVIHYSKAKGYT